MKILILLIAISGLAMADVYLHSPRGSNDRLDEEGRERDNANRLFDSQNNNRGGYNVGNVYYYTGSQMYVEWTNQHSCGKGNNANCEIIMQYMCDSRIRDGTTRTTAPDRPVDCHKYDCDADGRFGRHESFYYYQQCKWRQRNGGLFLGSQTLNGNSARFTRQNPGGTRHGYECPEERDYYPYWGPTPWIDIAVLTNDIARCPSYQAQSQNVAARSYCDIPANIINNYLRMRGANAEAFIPITRSSCESLQTQPQWQGAGLNATGMAVWRTQAAWGVPPPFCGLTPNSRDNHLGNVQSGYPASFNWTIPTSLAPSERCAFRLRYNISTGEFSNNVGGSTLEFQSDSSVLSGSLNASMNQARTGGNANNNPAQLDVWSRFGLTRNDVAASFPAAGQNTVQQNTINTNSRDYVFKNNPQVDITGPVGNTAGNRRLRLQLAVNTAQYGRTFQDRSHRFAIRTAPASIPANTPIYNLQVRGKRGNIVQVYPGVEYDFAPTRLTVAPGHVIHFQWTGSNTNPDNNAGQGKAGTDRSNVVVLHEPTYTEVGLQSPSVSIGHFANSYPYTNAVNASNFLGLSRDDLLMLATQTGPLSVQFGGNIKQFDDCGTYFDLGPRVVGGVPGTYHYMSTRNNDFSNRGHKAMITVDPTYAAYSAMALAATGGVVQVTSANKMANGVSVTAEQGALLDTVQVQVTVFAPDSNSQVPGYQNSGFVQILPQILPFSSIQMADQAGYLHNAFVTVSIPYSSSGFSKLLQPKVYWASSVSSADWTLLPNEQVFFNSDSGTAAITASQGGIYVVRNSLFTGAVAGIVVGLIALFAVAGGGYFWYRRRYSLPSSDAAAHDEAKERIVTTELSNRS